MTAQQAAVNSVLRGVVKPFLAFTSFHSDKLHKRRPLLCGAASLFPVPGTVRINQFSLGRFWAEWVDALNNDSGANDRVLLYLHGGGYLAGSPITHRNITIRLARYVGCRVLAINYRKAPHYPYPFAGFMPQATSSLKEIGAFLRHHMKVGEMVELPLTQALARQEF